MTRLERARALLSGDTTLAIVGEETVTSSERGVKALMRLLAEGTFPKEAAVADKVIGKAAALLLVKGGAREVYAVTASAPAREVFSRYRIPFACQTAVERIADRAGTGLCPMETLCMGIDDPEEAFLRIGERLQISK